VERIGLIAGGGELPIIFAKEARKKGAKVIGFAIEEMASSDFDAACDRAHRLSIGQVKKLFFLLLTERIRKIAMLGKIDKSLLYDNSVERDERLTEFLNTTKAKNDYSILDKITAEFKKVGIDVVNGVEYLSHLFPSKGVLTERHPSEKEQGDISFGFGIAKEVARMDIGQTIVVKDKSVVAVEAMEGTDEAIARAESLCGEAFTVVKVSRPRQDMRWDVPVVGPDTVRLIAEKKGSALAIEEKRMFLIEKETCLKLAAENGISIVVMR
jgi:DUF1009 family protein